MSLGLCNCFFKLAYNLEYIINKIVEILQRGFMKSSTVFILLIFSIFSQTSFSQYKADVIYGVDDRRDVKDSSIYLQDLSKSTAALIFKSNMNLNKEEGFYKINTEPYGKNYSLCQDEAFYNQQTAAHCSGFLVAEDVIVTAGHCINVTNCKDTHFVFDFKVDQNGATPNEINYESVYSCHSIIARELTQAQDYAVIKLDRKVKNRLPLTLKKQGVSLGEEVTVIGHPSGLPTKVTTGGFVRDIYPGFFQTNLDTYGGNSGSAVFDSLNYEVAGILVRGESDYSYDSELGCLKSHRCDENLCRGEDVTQIDYVIKALGL